MKLAYKLFLFLFALYLCFHIGLAYSRHSSAKPELPDQKFDRLCHEMRMRESCDGKYINGKIVRGKYIIGCGRERGPWQFYESTFNYYKELFHMPGLQWRNSDDQDQLARMMIRKGYGWNWTTYLASVRKIFGNVDANRVPFRLTRECVEKWRNND
jgi:hypothetical protein